LRSEIPEVRAVLKDFLLESFLVNIAMVDELHDWVSGVDIVIWIACFAGGIAVTCVVWSSFYRDLKKRSHDQDDAMKLKSDDIRVLEENIAVLKKELEETERELEESRTEDTATELVHRHHFNEIVEKEWKRLFRTKRPVGLVLVEIDFFDKFAEEYGPLVTTGTLKKIAKLIKQSPNRPADIAARYDDKKFVILLPETEEDGVLRVSEHVRRNVEMLRLPTAYSSVSQFVTISCGAVSVIPQQHSSPTILFAMSERALHSAKNKGGNCVSL
jgi:diguanylate cyclase (GGDEF)-like protein